MFPIDFKEISDFCKCKVNGIPALFTENRINRNSVPEEMHVYDIRSVKLDGEVLTTIEPYAIDGYIGSIVTTRPLRIPNNRGCVYLHDWVLAKEQTYCNSWRERLAYLP